MIKEKWNVMKWIRFILAVVLLCNIIILNGCSGDIENVEQRDYATILMISLPEIKNKSQSALKNENVKYHYVLGIAKEHHVGERGEVESFFEADGYDLDDLAKIYGESEGKELSLLHLKVILTAVDFNNGGIGSGISRYDKKGFFEGLVYELDRQDEIAKTCPVLMVENEAEIIKYLNNSTEPVAVYISDLVKNANRNGKKIPKLMNYLKFFREEEKIKIYRVDVNGEYLRLECIAGNV